MRVFAQVSICEWKTGCREKDIRDLLGMEGEDVGDCVGRDGCETSVVSCQEQGLQEVRGR